MSLTETVERNAEIVRLHLDDGLNLSDIGRLFDLTRGRVRQLVVESGNRTLTRDRQSAARAKRRQEHGARQAARLAYRDSLDFIRDRSAVDANGCWIWQLARQPTGYGHLTWKGRGGGAYAHRVSYEIANGPIPAGLTIDHLCRVRACVNPAHLEAVTHRENVLRSPIAPAAINARKTHCIHGHEFTPENTYRSYRTSAERRCKECHRRRTQEYLRRKKVAA